MCVCVCVHVCREEGGGDRSHVTSKCSQLCDVILRKVFGALKGPSSGHMITVIEGGLQPCPMAFFGFMTAPLTFEPKTRRRPGINKPKERWSRS